LTFLICGRRKVLNYLLNFAQNKLNLETVTNKKKVVSINT